jgi:hypothetical protein
MLDGDFSKTVTINLNLKDVQIFKLIFEFQIFKSRLLPAFCEKGKVHNTTRDTQRFITQKL